VFLHGAVFTTKLPVPVDEVARGYPYRGVVGEVTPRNPRTNDTAKLFLPWMEVAREELFHLRPPLWNRYSFSGYPLLGNGESAPFSPFFLATLFVPLPKQIVAMAGLKIFTALLFGWLFTKRYGTSDAAACFAATAFAWSVFQTVFLYYSTTAVTALLPAALYALLLATESRRGIVLAALVVATLMANGHPESVLHIAIAAGGLLLIERPRQMFGPIYAAVLGLALSAPAWVPTLQQVLVSSRLADLRRAGGHAAAYPLTAAWAMVMPNGFGNPVGGNWNWILNDSLVAASYVGLIVLVLFAAAAVSRKTSTRERLWIMFAVALWLIAMGWLPVDRIPPFSITTNDKLRFAALFIAAVIAARYLDRARRLVLLPFAIAAVATALYVYAKSTVLQPQDLFGAAAVLLLLMIPRPSVAFVLIAAELFLLNSAFNALVDARYYKPRLPIVEELRRIAPREPFRIAGYEWMFLPNASAHYGLEDVRGSDPMAFDRYTELLKQITVDEPAIDFDRIVTADHRLYDLLNVRYLMAEPGASFGGRWRRVYDGRDGTLFENSSVLPRFFVREGDADVRIRQRSPLRYTLRIEARTPALIASSQIAEGWVVREARMERQEGLFVGFRLPAGTHKVEVVYLPLAFYGTLPLTLLALVFLVWNRTLPRAVMAGP
jgi:hypothetical protein